MGIAIVANGKGFSLARFPELILRICWGRWQKAIRSHCTEFREWWAGDRWVESHRSAIVFGSKTDASRIAAILEPQTVFAPDMNEVRSESA